MRLRSLTTLNFDTYNFSVYYGSDIPVDGVRSGPSRAFSYPTIRYGIVDNRECIIRARGRELYDVSDIDLVFFYKIELRNRLSQYEIEKQFNVQFIPL
jgi:hypothetical protein